MNDPTAAHASQVAAAAHLLDRACGKPAQSIEQKVEGPQFVMMLPAVAASEDEWLKQMQADAGAQAKGRRQFAGPAGKTILP